MSIKASKSDLAALLRGDEDANNGLSSVSQKKPQPKPPEIPPVAAPAALSPVPLPASPPAVTPSPGHRPYRSQGLTIYESDEEIVDEMIAHLRRSKLKIGRKRGFSLFARAGLRALDRLRQTDPQSFEAMLRAALADQT
jgi:hypothetical protein